MLSTNIFSAQLNRNGQTTKNGLRTIVISIYQTGTRKRISLSTHIHVKAEDFAYGKVQPSDPNYDVHNRKISRIIRRLMEIEDELSASGTNPSPQMIRDALVNNVTKSSTLRDFSSAVIDGDSSRCQSTKRSYRYLVNDMEGSFGRLTLSDITYDLIIRYRELHRRKGLSENLIL